MSNHPTELKHLDKDDEARVGETIVSGDEGLADSADYQEFVALERVFAEERLKSLTRKVDWHVLPQLIIIYLLSYIDRTNVGNARLFGAEADMGLSATDWNMGLTVFFITYALAGPPSNIALKKFGPKRVLPTILLCVSLVLVGSGCAHSKAQWLALRLLLGIFEAGMFPGCAYTLTTWYTPAQIHSRMTIFYVGASGAGAFSGLLAYGIGQLDGTWGYRGWRFIYIIEGLISFVVALIAYFWIQERPAKQGRWLDAEEQRYLVLRNRFMYGAARAGTGSKDEFNWPAIVSALKSWHVHVMSIMFFTVCVAVYGLSFTLPTIMANMGFSAANAQALSAPPYIFACICVLASGWYSDKYRKRMWAEVIPSIVGFVGLLICVLTVTHKNLIALTYIGVSLAAGGLYCLSPCIAVWIGLNTAGQTKRAAAISITVVAAQLGGLAGSNIYIASEKPGYPTGFGVSLGVLGLGNILIPFIYYYIVGRINKKRDQMDEDAIYQKYTQEELADMGDLSPFYRYER